MGNKWIFIFLLYLWRTVTFRVHVRRSDKIHNNDFISLPETFHSYSINSCSFFIEKQSGAFNYFATVYNHMGAFNALIWNFHTLNAKHFNHILTTVTGLVFVASSAINSSANVGLHNADMKWSAIVLCKIPIRSTDRNIILCPHRGWYGLIFPEWSNLWAANVIYVIEA